MAVVLVLLDGVVAAPTGFLDSPRTVGDDDDDNDDDDAEDDVFGRALIGVPVMDNFESAPAFDRTVEVVAA